MRARSVLTLLLGAFVVVALIVVARQSGGRKTVPTSGQAVQNTPPAAAPVAGVPAGKSRPVSPASVGIVPASAPPTSGGNPEVAVPKRTLQKAEAAKVVRPAAPAHKVVAMYFHGDIRCTTCRKVEAYAREAVESGFAPQVASGAVEFRAVNVDRDENKHFIEDYQLTNKSVVVVDEAGGKVERWVKLDNVWGLVGNHDAYMHYVQDAVKAYVEN